MIQRIFTLLPALMILLFGSRSFSSYLLELKSGACFVTDRYWEEDGQIKCNLLGGTTGFHKATIKSITETDRPSEPESVTEETAADTETAAIEQEDEDIAKPKSNISDFEKEMYIVQKADIENQADNASSAYKNAKTRSERIKIEKKISELRKKHADLVNKIKEQNNGSLPNWWDEPSNPKSTMD